MRSLIENANSSLTYFNNKCLKDIDSKMLNKYIREYQSKTQCSNARINRIVSTLKATISRAVEYGYIQSNKLSNFKSLNVSRSKIRYLSNEETKRFFEALEK